MWQRFTERARRVILLGQEEASTMASGAVGTEHLLLGLIRETEGVAAQILANREITLERIRTEIEAASKVESSSGGEPKLTPKAKRVLELAADEARRMKHNYIGSEHLLVALLREKDGLAATVLRTLGLNLDKARKQVEEYLGPGSPEAAPQSSATSEIPLQYQQYQRLIAAKNARIQLLERELAEWRAVAQTVKMVIQETEKDWPLENSSEPITNEGNLDFPDVQSVIQSAGTTLVITGIGSGDLRARDTSQEVISSPLFESLMVSARRLLINVTGGADLAIGEVEEIVRVVREASGIEEANVFWGVVFKPEMQGSISATVVATGFDHPPENLGTANVT